MKVSELIIHLQKLEKDGRGDDPVVVLSDSGFVTITAITPNEEGPGIELTLEQSLNN